MYLNNNICKSKKQKKKIKSRKIYFKNLKKSEKNLPNQDLKISQYYLGKNINSKSRNNNKYKKFKEKYSKIYLVNNILKNNLQSQSQSHQKKSQKRIKEKKYQYQKNNKLSHKIIQKGQGIFEDLVYNTSHNFIFPIFQSFAVGLFPESQKIFNFFENPEKGGKLIALGLKDEAIVNVYIPFGINCLQIYFLVMGFILLQIASLLSVTVVLAPGGLVIGFFSAISYTFSGSLIAAKNIYLSASLNYNLDQINNIISNLISNDSNSKINRVMNKFFKQENVLIVIGDKLQEIMSANGIKYIIKNQEDIDEETNEHFMLESKLSNLIRSIEDIISELEFEDLKILFDKGKLLLEHICFAISNFLSLQLQYDSGIIGYSIKILICDSYPDKIDTVLKHLFKFIPSFILNLLIDQKSLLKSMEQKSEIFFKFFENCPESIFNLLKKNFPKVNWAPIYKNLLPINDFSEIIVEYLRNFNQVLIKNLKIVGLFLPLILIFSTIRYQFMIKKDQRDQKNESEKISKDKDEKSKKQQDLLKQNIEDFQSQINLFKIKDIIQPVFKIKIHNIINQ